MAQIEKTNQIDQYLEQIDKKQDSSNKKRIILVVALLVLTFGAIFGYSQLAGKEVLADNGTSSDNLAGSNMDAATITVADNENAVTDDELLAELEAEEAAAAAAAGLEDEVAEDEDEPVAEKKPEERPTEAEEPKNINQSTPGVSNASFTAEQLGNVPTAKTFKPENNDSNKSEKTPDKEPTKPEVEDVVTEKGGTEEVVEAPKPEEVVEAPKPEEVEPVAEKPAAPTGITRNPSFPGGEGKMRQFFARRISYPNKAINKKIEGSVKVRVKVDEDGKIIDSQVVDGIGGGCDREVLKAISKMPKWEPALENGVAVPKFYLLSVAFRLPK